MNKVNSIKIMQAGLLLAYACGYHAAASAADLYVATTGSDNNPGTKSAPFRTILKASEVARPGTTVHVAAGTYIGNFVTAANGTALARIRYVSDTKWGAKIVADTSSARIYAWGNTGDYVDIEGFHIDGQNSPGWHYGIVTRGSENIIKNNHVHHIAQNATCNNLGGAAIASNFLDYGVNTRIVNNVVHHIGFDGCRYIHGIYLGTTGKILNNLVYAIGYAAIHMWHDATYVTVAHNTVFSSGYGIYVGSGDAYYRTTPIDYTDVYNNIVYDNKVGIAERGYHGRHNTFVNNLVYKNSYADWSIEVPHKGTIAAEPVFIGYRRDGSGNYRLQSTSPAIDRGVSALHVPPTDLDGISRPRGRANDIGAYEYH